MKLHTAMDIAIDVLEGKPVLDNQKSQALSVLKQHQKHVKNTATRWELKACSTK